MLSKLKSKWSFAENYVLTALASRKPCFDFHDEINSSDSTNILLLMKLEGISSWEKSTTDWSNLSNQMYLQIFLSPVIVILRLFDKTVKDSCIKFDNPCMLLLPGSNVEFFLSYDSEVYQTIRNVMKRNLQFSIPSFAFSLRKSIILVYMGKCNFVCSWNLKGAQFEGKFVIFCF